MLYAVVPFIALQNTSIDVFRDHAIHEGWDVNPLVLGAVGAGAGIVAQTAVFPLEVLRRRQQVECDTMANPNKELPSRK